MTTKLVQKHLFKGTQEFELLDDEVRVRIKSRFGQEESLTVMLAVLNPEPVISKSLLEFTSRVNNEPLLSLYLAKPNQKAFNAFVNLLKQKAQEEFQAFAGLKAGTPAGLQSNVYDEPPDFGPSDGKPPSRRNTPLRPADIESAMGMLVERLGTEDIGSFLAALESLRSDPENDAHLSRVVDEFGSLGPLQGAVLSYAPYIIAVLSDDPYENM